VAVARVATIANDNQASLRLTNDRQARDVIGECARRVAGNAIIYVSRFAYVIIQLCARSPRSLALANNVDNGVNNITTAI